MTVKNLRYVSVIYLLLPNLIFFYSWTRSSVAVTGIIILIYLASDDYRDSGFKSRIFFSSKDLFIVGITGLALTLLSGTAGFCYQTLDYWSHHTKYNELFINKWPIRIPSNGPVISYYYGYYVVPALFFKLYGSINETFIVLWTTTGISIGIAWVYLVLNKKIWFVLLAMCMGDFPHVIKNIFSALSINMYTYSHIGIEHWSVFENLFWVPNQVIPSLIIAGMLVYILRHNLKTYLIIFPVCLSFWWAIFPAFALGILTGCLLLKEWLTSTFKPTMNLIAKKYILPAVICIPIFIFFLSHGSAPVSGFIWNFRTDYLNLLSEYSVNILVNVIVFMIVYWSLKKLNFKTIQLFPFFIVLILTIVFPIYRLGKVNDFLFRGMMPLLLISGIYLCYPLTTMEWKSTVLILKRSYLGLFVILILLATSTLAVRRIWRAVAANRFITNNRTAPREGIPYDAYPNVYEVLLAKWSRQEANQYLGKAGSLYEQFIAPDKSQNGSILHDLAAHDSAVGLDN
jgi:hypothetical protein